MSKKTLFMVLSIMIALVASSVYFFLKYKGVSEELKKKSEGADKTEVLAVLAKVSKLIEIPTDEEPTVATVTDKEKLKEQKFFAKAENEDKVIIFVKAQKAILYRPSTNKIIEVARIDTIDQKKAEVGTSTTSAQVKTQKISLSLLNGTTTEGLTNSAVGKLTKSDNFEVSKKSAAKRVDYEKTLVVDLGVGKQVAESVAAILGMGQVTNKMPEGEATPSSQLVVILGTDYANVQ